MTDQNVAPDSKGTLAAWSQLLKCNPELEPAKKPQVEKIMADVRGELRRARPGRTCKAIRSL